MFPLLPTSVAFIFHQFSFSSSVHFTGRQNSMVIDTLTMVSNRPGFDSAHRVLWVSLNLSFLRRWGEYWSYIVIVWIKKHDSRCPVYDRHYLLLLPSLHCIISATSTTIPTYSSSPVTSKINQSLRAIWCFSRAGGFVARKTVFCLQPAGIPDIMGRGDLKLFFFAAGEDGFSSLFLSSWWFYSCWLRDGNK